MIEYSTKVVNIYKDKYDIYIGRSGKNQSGYFGNPFKLKDFNNDRLLCLYEYKKYFDNKIATDDIFRKNILELKGKILGCFCKPKLCHGDIIAEWLEYNS